MLICKAALGSNHLEFSFGCEVSSSTYRLLQPHCWHIQGLVQDCSISSVLAMKILQSCTKPSTWSSEQKVDIFSFIFLNESYIISNSNSIKFVTEGPIGLKQVNAITSTNDGRGVWCHMVSPGHNELRMGTAFTLWRISMKYLQHHKPLSPQRPLMEHSCCSLTLNKRRKQWIWFANISKYKHVSFINLSMSLMTEVWWSNTFI